MPTALDTVLQNPAIWRGDQHARTTDSIPSGFPELDALLPGSGWPRGALAEILFEREGVSELSLFMPTLARLSHADSWIALVAPPYLPYAPALAKAGIELSRLLLVRAQSPRDKLWAVEQVLRSGACTAVLFWLPAPDDRSQRRLQLAAEEGGSLGVFFNRADSVIRPSPAALKLRVSPDHGRLRVQILKRRGGGVAAPLSLEASGVAKCSAPVDSISVERYRSAFQARIPSDRLSGYDRVHEAVSHAPGTVWERAMARADEAR